MPITQTQAALFRLSGVNAGRPATEMMPGWMRDKVLADAATKGVDPQIVIDTAADAGTDQDQRIALLEAYILHASDRIAGWLADNTEERFEEIPEVDGILTTLREAVD